MTKTKSKKVKAVKAWAIADKSLNIVYVGMNLDDVMRVRASASSFFSLQYDFYPELLLEVEIRPVRK